MKFGDKLIILRKKNGLSQEDLAEKLGVSRQSVSKWESNNTYPETDKIVQICNLFDCSMDDLINDKVTDIEGSLRKNKNNFNEAWDSLLEFITKTINMFSHMKFSTGIKCVIEMSIVAFILWLIGLIICGISSSIIANLFGFFGTRVTSIIQNILHGVFSILWFIIAIIALVHTFRIRYLNYYEESKIEKKEKTSNNKTNVEEDKTKPERVIIKNEKDKPFAFLSALSKIVLFCIKFIVFWLAFITIFILVGLVIASVISLALMPTNLIFVGSSLSLVAIAVIAVLFLLLCIYFIISKKVNAKVFIITFLISIVAFGAGIGISITSIRKLNIVKIDDKDISTKQLTIEYEDNLVILSPDLYESNQYIYIKDDSIPKDTILVDISYNHNNKKLKTKKEEEDKLNVLEIRGEFKDNPNEVLKLISEDLKNNKIVIDHFNSEINSMTIKANTETIDRLIANTEKLYLLEKEVIGNTIKIEIHGDKVYIYGGRPFVEYNALTDELIYTEIAPENFKCSRTVRKTAWGDRIEYNCLESDEDYE